MESKVRISGGEEILQKRKEESKSLDERNFYSIDNKKKSPDLSRKKNPM
jgi:hypothetical protein